jgi:hypothetical protein
VIHQADSTISLYHVQYFSYNLKVTINFSKNWLAQTIFRFPKNSIETEAIR